MKLRDYVIRRLILLVPVLLGVTLVTFTLTRVVGDPVAPYVTEKTTDLQIEAIRRLHGLDRPIYEQYGYYMRDVLTGDLGFSRTEGNRPVGEVISYRLPVTLELTLPALFLSVLFGIPLGTLSATQRDRPLDHATRVFALSGVSVPIFWLALMLQLSLGGQDSPLTKWMTSSGILCRGTFLPDAYLAGNLPTFAGSPDCGAARSSAGLYASIPKVTGMYSVDAIIAGNWAGLWDAMRNLALPVVCLMYTNLAIITRLMRSSMLESMGQEYVKTARSKGLPESVVIQRHARRNALVPVTTVVGLSVGGILGGAVLTESVFSIPGLGRWSTTAITGFDHAAITSFVLLTAISYVVANLIVDVVYAWIDPRIRLG
jgi:peptide/nickel transport system permease protein